MVIKLLVLERPAQKQLNKLPLKIHRKIIQALKRVKGNPLSGVKLYGELEKYYKLRVGDYRIVYSFNLSTGDVKAAKVEHRQGVYK